MRMLRKVLVALVLAVSSVGLLNVQPVAALTLVQRIEWWFLAGTRACLGLVEHWDDGNGHFQVWCYNDNDTAVLGAGDFWFRDYFFLSVVAGNGVGNPAVIQFIADHQTLPSPYPNYAAEAPVGFILDYDHAGQATAPFVDRATLSDYYSGYAWWSPVMTPLDFGARNNNSALEYAIN